MSGHATDDRSYQKADAVGRKDGERRKASLRGVVGWRCRRRTGARDNIKTGRLHWRQAYDEAIDGINALKSGDREMAELCVWTATDFYIGALENRSAAGHASASRPVSWKAWPAPKIKIVDKPKKTKR